MMYKSRKIDTYYWFCDPGSHLIFHLIIQCSFFVCVCVCVCVWGGCGGGGGGAIAYKNVVLGFVVCLLYTLLLGIVLFLLQVRNNNNNNNNGYFDRTLK